MQSTDTAPDIEFKARLVKRTPKAILVSPLNDPFNKVWLPLAALELVSDPVTGNEIVWVQMDRAFALQKGIIV